MPKTLDDRAREIMESDGVGMVVARIRAAKEAFGIPPSGRPMNKAEVRNVVIDGSIVPFAVLMQTASDERSSEDTRIMASDKYLTHAIKLAGAEDHGDSGKVTIVVRGGLPEDTG